jgi:hypothetical protein
VDVQWIVSKHDSSHISYYRCLVDLLHFFIHRCWLVVSNVTFVVTPWYGMLLDVSGVNNNKKDYKSIPLLQWKDYKSILLLQWKDYKRILLLEWQDYKSIPLLQWKAWTLYLSCLHDEMPTTKAHLTNIYYLCDIFSLQRINQW